MNRRGRKAQARIQIRKLRQGEVGLLQGARNLLDHPLDNRAARHLLADPAHHLWLASSEHRVVGFLRSVELLQLHTPRRQMFLYEIAVRPDSRGQGVGSMLVEAMLQYSRGRGFEEAFVLTDDPANKAAHALYKSTGGRTETTGDRMYVWHLAHSAKRRTRSTSAGRFISHPHFTGTP